MPSSPCPTSVSAPLTTATKTEDTFTTVAPTAIAQPPAATASTTAESTARMQQLSLEDQVRNHRRAALQPTPAAGSPKKKQKTTSVAKSVVQANAKSAVQPKAKAKTAPKQKPKDKTAPKLKAKTAKQPKANAKSFLKANAKAKSAPKATTKQGLKPTTTTTKPSKLPSQPADRMFWPITWGPVTIYHGGKQRKYRLKEYPGSRRTTSFNDWQQMMKYIRRL